MYLIWLRFIFEAGKLLLGRLLTKQVQLCVPI